jgi:hypothetical protein
MQITFNRLGCYGRLGNQMFQYAALLGIANKLNYTPAINYSLKSNNPKFNLELDDYFNITANNSVGIPIHRIFQEHGFSFDANAFNIPPHTDIFGYFQSEKYFKHIQDKIKSEFTFKNENNLKEKFKPVKDKVKTQIVSLHIRRTDYTELVNYYPFSFEYYKKSLLLLKEKIGNFCCVVFTDDIAWVRNNIDNLLIEDINFVLQQGTKEEDLYFMTQCDHNIIANSSFSWWGAWLNNNPNKQVIAPSAWFGCDGPPNWQDIYCDGWTVL